MKPLQMLSIWYKMGKDLSRFRRLIIFFGLSCVYIFWYMRQVRKPRVVMKQCDPIMSRLLLKQLKIHQLRYYPLFFATGGWAQALVLFILSAKAYFEYLFGFRKMRRYERTMVRTDQGNAVLDWVKPPRGCQSKPVVVIFPSITGRHEDILIRESVDLLVAARYEVVVYNRRGHENESEYFSVIGDPYMTDIVLASIARKRPGRGLFLFGFSAGTGTMCRWMQDIALERRSCWNDVRFSIMLSPGYTSDFDPEANLWAFN